MYVEILFVYRYVYKVTFMIRKTWVVVYSNGGKEPRFFFLVPRISANLQAHMCCGQQSPQRNDVFCDGLLRVLNPNLHISPIVQFDLVQEHLKRI